MPYCVHCATANVNGAQFCKACGTATQVPIAAVKVTINDDRAVSVPISMGERIASAFAFISVMFLIEVIGYILYGNDAFSLTGYLLSAFIAGALVESIRRMADGLISAGRIN